MYTIEDNKIYFDKDFKVEDLEFLGKGANANIYKIKIEDEWNPLKIFTEKEYWKYIMKMINYMRKEENVSIVKYY